MEKQLNKLIIVPIVFLIFIAGAVSVSADVEWVYGKAVNSDGEFEFLEEHIIKYENDRIANIKTTYYDAGLKKIGQQVSDFSHGPQFGSYDFKDERLQYHDGARVMSDQILIYCKEAPEVGIKKKYLRKDSNQIVGQGFHQFIVTNLDSLVQGAIIRAKLVLPAHMDQFDIRICKRKVENGRIQIRIELDNWFLRLFTSHLEAEYDLSSRRLLSYRGFSMISDLSGKTVEVEVSYDYPQQRPLLSSLFKSKSVGLERD
ncbi:MAG: hypothetical protein PVI82_09670 [Desulfobacterales bacterium]|jgi:hypothetical protein